jgi:hypothetical protein
VKIPLQTELEKVCGKLVTNAWQIEERTHENCALKIVLIAVKLLTCAGIVDECKGMGFISQTDNVTENQQLGSGSSQIS